MNLHLGNFYFFLIGAGLLMSILGLWFITILPSLERWSMRFFRYYYVVLMVNCVLAMSELLAIHFRVPVAVIYTIMFLESMFLAVPQPMLTLYLLHCSGENMRTSRLWRAVYGLWSLYVIQVIVAQLFGGFAYITPDMKYFRKTGYPILLLPMILIMLINLVGTVKRRKLLSRKRFISFLVAILPMTVAVFVQLFIDVFPLIDFSVVLTAISMYMLVLSDQIEQDLSHQREIARQQLEITNQRTSIMVLQMRPHFIYNTMTSIYCLCNQDPEKARQVIMDFTTYLRKNFTAVASAAPIPFTAELEHARAYLAVEQAQYEDSLFVDYDTPHTFFRVPPLTLQPIVENAVKHGRDPYAGPLHVSVKTRKTDTGNEIIVSDNGRGYGAAGDGDVHIALDNIRQRLEIMCGGELAIQPNEGGGTIVRVTIPDNENLKS